MKKLLLSILTILITVIMIIAMKFGINIGSLHIPGFQGIADENQKLLTVIQQAENKNNEYYDKLETINSDAEKLASAKKDYYDLVQVSTENEIQQATQIKSYRVEYLWSRVGNHATQEGVKVKMEIVSSDGSDSAYKNLNFTATGSYLGITNFIYDIENDESLDFTIDNFTMDDKSATFVVKDIKIIQEAESTPSQSTSSTDNTTANNTTTSDKDKLNQQTNAIANTLSPTDVSDPNNRNPNSTNN